jgi:type I restriction enzyme S subunit
MTPWKMIALGEATTIVGGGTPARGNPEFYGGTIPWVTPKDMKSWEIYGAQLAITQAGVENSATRVVPPNSVLIVVRSGVLKHTLPVALNRVPVAINQDMKALQCSEDFYPDFLARFIKARSPEILQWVRATTADNFPIDLLRKLPVPIPSLDEQRRIAAILGQSDALRAKRRAARVQLDILTQAIFLDIFGDPVSNPKGWARVAFSELLEGIDSGWSPTCLDRPIMEAEWGVLKLGAVTRCEYNPAENKALPPDVNPDPALEVKPGDLLFTRKNTYELVAACALVRETPPRLMMSDLIFRFRLRRDAPIEPQFLHQLLIYPSKRIQIQKLAGGSAGSMPNISKSKLETALIEVPPLNFQREFANRISSIQKLKDAYRSSLAKLEMLFDSLQQRAFRGEL